MADLLRFSVPGKPEYVGVVRLAVSSAANTAGFDVEDIEDIKIAVSEVCTYVFCSNGNELTYEVSCELGDDGIVISIDDLNEHDDLCPMEMCTCLPENGMVTDMFDPSTSILMLRALMDEVDVFSDRDESMLIRMFKHL